VPDQVLKYLVQKTLTYILMLKILALLPFSVERGQTPLYKGHTNTLGSKSMISNKNLNKNMLKNVFCYFLKNC